MENKQTAVEWLVSKLPQRMLNYLEEEIEQANEKHKEQIMKAARQCHFEGVRQSAKTSEEYIAYGEQYYNETYGK